MTVRSLDILDLPLLTRYNRQILSLDSARMLTHGNPLGALALLSYLNPRRFIYTAIASENGTTLMGQVILKGEENSARLTFLAPADHLNSLTLPLLDHLTVQAGDWGAAYLSAEVDEDSSAFRSLRQAGFAMYAWQRVWRLPKLKDQGEGSSWRAVDETDWPAVQSLPGQLVPALLQPVDTLPRSVSGLVCRPEGNLQAYVAVEAGSAGIWVQPLVPPDSGCGPERLAGLSRWGSRPVYVCVRSYQAWLETVLQDLGAQPGPRQAVMVRRLVKPIKEPLPVSVMEKALAKVKPAAPVSRMEGDE